MRILQGFMALALVCALVAGGVGAAFAQGNPSGGPPGLHSRHGLFGEVSGKNDDGFTLTTRQGDKVTVTVNGGTKFKIPSNPRLSSCDISDGDWVAITGTWVGGNFAARIVHLVPGQGLHFHFVGEVKAKATNDSNRTPVSITVDCKKVGEITFSVNGDTLYRPEGTTFEAIQKGDMVTVVASGWDAEAGTATAVVIVLH